MNAVLIVAFLSAMLLSMPQASSPDAEGFIRNWLVLAPIPIEGESGASEIDKDFLKGEATIRAQGRGQGRRSAARN